MTLSDETWVYAEDTFLSLSPRRAGSFLRHRPSEGNQSADPASVVEWRTPIYANRSATYRKVDCGRFVRSVGRRAYALMPDWTRQHWWFLRRPIAP